MNKKWIRLTLSDGLGFRLKEVRAWCEENCRYKFRVRRPQIATGCSYLWKKPYATFQEEIDAMAFKMRWL